jgi:hypothetical protein
MKTINELITQGISKIRRVQWNQSAYGEVDIFKEDNGTFTSGVFIKLFDRYGKRAGRYANGDMNEDEITDYEPYATVLLSDCGDEPVWEEFDEKKEYETK